MSYFFVIRFDLYFSELINGTPVFTPEGKRVGDSKKAARKGIFLVCLSRVAMAMPGMSTYEHHIIISVFKKMLTWNPKTSNYIVAYLGVDDQMVHERTKKKREPLDFLFSYPSRERIQAERDILIKHTSLCIYWAKSLS